MVGQVAMTPTERQLYEDAVIKAVYGKAGLVLVKADAIEVQKWMDQEIPLRVVLQAMSELPKRPSIRYCGPAVLTEWSRSRHALRIG